MRKQIIRESVWTIALLFSIFNAVSIFLPFISARDITELAHHMVFRGINLQEVSIWGIGVAVAPLLYVSLLLSRLPGRDKIWLWFITVVFQGLSFTGARIDVQQWLVENATSIERNIGLAIYPVLSIAAAALVFLAIHISDKTSDKLTSLPAPKE